MQSTSACCNNIMRLKEELDTADAVVIGAGSGLSTSAGFTYTGERFQRYFGDFIAKYDFRDMYSLCQFGRTLGVLEPVYLRQSLSGRTEAGLSRAFAAGAGQELFCSDDQCRPLLPEGWV